MTINLPVPSIPPTRSFPPAGEVSSVVGQSLAGPLVELEAAFTAADQAVQDLTAHRPGGAVWTQALEDDAAAYGTAETRPRKWKLAQLIEGDAARWALATAACRDLPAATARCEQRLDRVTIAGEAAGVESASAEEWAAAAWSGWTTRGDKAAAWQEVRRGETFLGEFLSSRRVKAWAEGQGWGARPDLDARVPRIDYLPEDPVARGAWLALGLFLSPEPWLSMPQGVEWPEGAEQLVITALPGDGARYTALVTTGVHVERK